MGGTAEAWREARGQGDTADEKRQARGSGLIKIGGRYWDRTSDPSRVKGVLSR